MQKICRLSGNHAVNSRRIADEFCCRYVFAALEAFAKEYGIGCIEQSVSCKYGIAASVTRICRCLFSRKETILTVSTLIDGEYGIKDVALSIMSVVGCDGIKTNVAPPLVDSEVESLVQAADMLKSVIKQVEW